jgi:hypothetical protein
MRDRALNALSEINGWRCACIPWPDPPSPKLDRRMLKEARREFALGQLLGHAALQYPARKSAM